MSDKLNEAREIINRVEFGTSRLKGRIEAINKLKKENPKLTEEEINEKSSLAIMDSLDDFIYIIEKMAYILIVSADSSQVGSFEDFLKGIPKVKLDDQWIVEVTNKMVSSFC